MPFHKHKHRGIGIMTGTSLDGIDLVEATFYDAPPMGIEGAEPAPRWVFSIDRAETVPLPDAWRARLQALPSRSASVLAQTHVDWGHYLGKTAADWIEQHSLKPQFVACHGQTIFHQPENGFTTQIGDGETMVSYLKVPLITQFRNKDVALGGQGAPLVPFGERLLFSQHAALLNLGGIANLSAGDQAMDVCVCNMALNRLIRRLLPECTHDVGGQVAASGQIHQALLTQLEGIDWYQIPPPRSLGEEWFERNWVPRLDACQASVPDQLATLCEHIALRITDALGLMLAKKPAQSGHVDQALGQLTESSQPDHQPTLLISGGGVHHTHLMQRLAWHMQDQGLGLKPVVDPVLTNFKEALIFAFLGLQVLLGQPNVLKSVTGSSGDHLGGSLHLPPGGGWRLVPQV